MGILARRSPVGKECPTYDSRIDKALLLQSIRFAEQLLDVRSSTTLCADMRGVADQKLVARKIRFELLFHFAQSFGHLQHPLQLEIRRHGQNENNVTVWNQNKPAFFTFATTQRMAEISLVPAASELSGHFTTATRSCTAPESSIDIVRETSH